MGEGGNKLNKKEQEERKEGKKEKGKEGGSNKKLLESNNLQFVVYKHRKMKENH